MIDVNNLTKKYYTQKAVDNITFSVKKGEIVGFLGPNGAGKTTTMKILTCYMPPNEGYAKIDGLDVMENSIDIRKKIGYVPENAPLYMDMSVYEHINFVAEVRTIAKSEREHRIREVVKTCGLKSVIHKDVGELSKGYRQRLCLAQAILHDPQILILDEPTSGLDPNQIVEIRSLIKTLGKEKTVILSTHILSEVHATCSRVLIINEGKIVADGTPKELQEGSKGGGENVHLKLKITEGQKDSIEPTLKGIEGVIGVRENSPEEDDIFSFDVRSKKNTDLRETIFKTVVANNWIIFEMKKDVASLEDVFRRLTTG